jgi:hypothetical protein
MSSLAVVWIASPIDLITESSVAGPLEDAIDRASIGCSASCSGGRIGALMFEPLAAIPATLEAIVRGWPTCLFQRLTVWSRVFGGPAAVLATSRASLFCHF